MEDWYKHPALVAITLVAAIVTSMANIKFNTDPYARPKAYTEDDGDAMERRSRQRNAAVWAWIRDHEDFKRLSQIETEHRLTIIEQHIERHP